MSKKRKGAGQGTGQVLKISDSPFLVVVEVFNQHVSALVDTGGAVSCVAAEKFPYLIIHSSTFTSLVGADNRPLRVKDTTMMKLRVQDRECEQKFFVVEALTHPLTLRVDC